jgi:pimeloyl-ACP methyl ester carboxylesterase
VTASSGLNYRRQGEGEPVVLVHGIGSELCVWEPVLDPLAAELDVIAVDLPGFGHSPALPEGVSPSPQALAGAVAGLLDELDLERAHLVGNSLGGWVALELGKTDRALSVTAICPAGLWGAPLRRPGGPPVRGRANSLARTLRPLLPALLRSRRARRLALGFVVADPDRVPRDAAIRMVDSYARATAYEATNAAMRETHFTDPDQIRVPLTVAFGELDRLIRPVRLDVPGARTLMLPGCGHIPMWDAPELVVEVIASTVRSGEAALHPAASA